MITADGKTLIKRYLADGTIARSISVGIGGVAENINDTKLQFEVDRFPVDVISYDFVSDQLVFKGVMPPELAGKIYEVGLWTAEENLFAGGYGSRIITSFDSETEEWDIETMESTIARIGVDSLKHTPALSTNVTSMLSNLELDMSGYSSADKFVFAYNVENTNCSSIRYRFKVDGSNYYEFPILNPAVGYAITELTKGSATIVGTPNWEDISQVSVTTSAKATGAASVEHDGIRVEDMDTLSPEYGLVARKVLAVPYVKEEGQAHEFEYALTVSI